jgi:hypothetical protein
VGGREGGDFFCLDQDSGIVASLCFALLCFALKLVFFFNLVSWRWKLLSRFL